MACNCNRKKSHTVKTSTGEGTTPLTIYTIMPSSDENEQKKTITTTGQSFIIKRGGTSQTMTTNKFFALKVTEIDQLLEKGAPIYVYG